MINSKFPPSLNSISRILYKTKRKDISHIGRVNRADKLVHLQKWRQFSRHFFSTDVSATAEQREWLHNRGFYSDKLNLYDFPSDEDQDSYYLSDYQVELIRHVNDGSVLLKSKVLFWRVFGQRMKAANLIAEYYDGSLHVFGSEPARVNNKSNLYLKVRFDDNQCFTETTSTLPKRIKDHQHYGILALPKTQLSEPGYVIRACFVFDPNSLSMQALGAHVIPLSALLSDSGRYDSYGLSVKTGLVLTQCNVEKLNHRLVSKQTVSLDLRRDQFETDWWAVAAIASSAFKAIPVLGLVQLDFLLSNDGPLMIDASECINAATFQVHGPLMKSAFAIEFLREFGV